MMLACWVLLACTAFVNYSSVASARSFRKISPHNWLANENTAIGKHSLPAIVVESKSTRSKMGKLLSSKLDYRSEKTKPSARYSHVSRVKLSPRLHPSFLLRKPKILHHVIQNSNVSGLIWPPKAPPRKNLFEDVEKLIHKVRKFTRKPALPIQHSTTTQLPEIQAESIPALLGPGGADVGPLEFSTTTPELYSDCAQFTTCVACADIPSCGWCTVAKACLPGNSTLPLSGKYGECDYFWVYSQRDTKCPEEMSQPIDQTRRKGEIDTTAGHIPNLIGDSNCDGHPGNPGDCARQKLRLFSNLTAAQWPRDPSDRQESRGKLNATAVFNVSKDEMEEEFIEKAKAWPKPWTTMERRQRMLYLHAAMPKCIESYNTNECIEALQRQIRELNLAASPYG